MMRARKALMAIQRDWEELLEDRLRALGVRDPSCSRADCNETNPFALIGSHPVILCYEHDAEKRDRSWLESHEPPGRANDPDGRPFPGNEHRILSARQQLWPRETLRNPDGSPVLRWAAWVRALLDVLWGIIER